MRAYASTLALIGARSSRGRKTSVSRRQPASLIAVGPRMVPFAAVENPSRKLGIEPRRLLRTVGIPDRTAARRKKQGFLAPEEADRLLPLARRVGDEWAWTNRRWPCWCPPSC